MIDNGGRPTVDARIVTAPPLPLPPPEGPTEATELVDEQPLSDGKSFRLRRGSSLERSSELGLIEASILVTESSLLQLHAPAWLLKEN